MQKLRVRIVGGSLAGLFAGILLKRDGHDVQIYERSSTGLAGRGAGLVAQAEVFHILRVLGLDHLARIGVVAKERIYFTRNGSIAERMNMPQTQISWDVLYSTVTSQFCPDDYILGRRVHKVSAGKGGAVITFDKGETEHADLVIGADGLGSVVRSALNERSENQYAGYTAWRGLITENALPEEASALIDRFSFYISRGIQVLGYLVPGSNGEVEPGKRRYNWVWFRPVDKASLQAELTGRDSRRFEFSLPRGEMSVERRTRLRRDALAMLPPPFAYAVSAEPMPSIQGVYDYESQHIARERVALIGDAAFVARPHTAMGVAKAAGDALSLHECLNAELALSSALARYEAERLPVGKAIVAYGRRLGATAL
ncbi:FAD-dependent monooxygenase [Ochrobactrum sp. SD129]|jgi:2-polyprenyl-6-methoxyphenol hydroxylase-like FAD-dependent oxidoreductase|nr:FAD-dependent monooxygenase [Ochrobactrum sp. SD129]